MKCGKGDVVEIVYVKKNNQTVTVFGEVKVAGTEKITIAVWEAPDHILEYDELNIHVADIIDIRMGGTTQEALDDLLSESGLH